MTKMTKNGVSTCTTPGEEKYEFFKTHGFRPKTLCQYDYRDTDGVLFSCCMSSLEECRKAKDEWLNSKQAKTNDKEG